LDRQHGFRSQATEKNRKKLKRDFQFFLDKKFVRENDIGHFVGDCCGKRHIPFWDIATNFV